MEEIKFRAWDKKNKQMHYLGNLEEMFLLAHIFNGKLNKDWSDIMQYTNLLDKNGKEIYEGDILKIRVNRQYYNTNKNINHSKENSIIYYLFAVVKDIRGNLKYNKNAVKELEKPIGKEKNNQTICYDTNLFNTHWSNYRVKDKNDWIRYTKKEDKNENIKLFNDYTIIGNIHENPELIS